MNCAKVKRFVDLLRDYVIEYSGKVVHDINPEVDPKDYGNVYEYIADATGGELINPVRKEDTVIMWTINRIVTASDIINTNNETLELLFSEYCELSQSQREDLLIVHQAGLRACKKPAVGLAF